ncbi:nitrite reductase large subunit NirB [Planctomyces sp. SH-PL62]|uniref:nitrite reductase large subunit NirB n=1 Tax=Planctomyces sp. SH-PL62 TaxID=1636152 RepID=UPI00078DF743|nr:nitrite reductase large subunit NirB [Planctomyces sp. SH-PL62]AMV38400.1 Nitrite reductase [NAD(P)H] [Planctomyces sp. SH-PL62]
MKYDKRKTVVVVGNGMVGHRFCERLVALDLERRYRIVTFCEEARPAYDRVNLSKFFDGRDADRLKIACRTWYAENAVDLHVGDRVAAVDRERRRVVSAKGVEVDYEALVFATGSAPFVPAVPGVDKKGIFVYRTIEDLEAILAYAPRAGSAAVIGGGLLGLEAAKAVRELGLETHVVEFAPRLMPRQIDAAGSKVLLEKIEAMNVRVHLGKSTREFLGNGKVEGLAFADGGELEVGMVVVSAGIRPRDELARACGLEIGPRGGVVVDDGMWTSDPEILAVGEVAVHRGTVYGLVAPGYEMADVAAANLTGSLRRFAGFDMSTKLKLMGVDVASFGDPFADADGARALTFEDPFRGVYKKLLFAPDGARLLGGVLVGDASDYGTLLSVFKSDGPLPVSPGDLLSTGRGPALGGAVDAQVCSCNNVGEGRVREAIRDQGLKTIAQVKECTLAGTGCGGCLPRVSELLKAELKAAGARVDDHLCEHFPHSRKELYQIALVRGIRTFEALIASYGRGLGCETCKPTVASILASLWNENVLDPAHATLQDTNDRFLGNIQRGGTYSVVPRVPGGEITPDQLIVLGRVAKTYGLYAKITGGQRVDLFGAPVHLLPDIWSELITAGFESGHAYGKSLRTVKSCVGSSWCRFGVQDSVGFAVRVELRYRGLRAPHKLKGAVSGCVRECAEAQGKDFGLIATEKGYNLYVGGNGGARPRHADLLASDLDEETALRYLDRFLMYYIRTADRLTRTSTWLENLEGGIDYLRDVIVDDRLGLAAELERQMQAHVDSYRCEWKAVVDDPEKRRFFKQFANTDDVEPGIEIVAERGQPRPADWPDDFVPVESLGASGAVGPDGGERSWVHVGTVADFPPDGGRAIKHGAAEIAVFRFASKGEWYACQNTCPHKREAVLSRGLLGDQQGVPKVACPLHKKTFSLESGACLSGDRFRVEVFPVRIDGDAVLVELPPAEDMGRLARLPQPCATACP